MTTITMLEQEFRKNQFFYAAMGIILSTCVGSVAVMGALSHGFGHLPMFLVTLSVLSCSAFNASILTVQKPELILKLLGLSVVLNVIIAAFTLSI